jgi:hypothetical protein
VLLLWDSGVDMLMVLLLGDLRRWGEGERVMLLLLLSSDNGGGRFVAMEMTKKERSESERWWRNT